MTVGIKEGCVGLMPTEKFVIDIYIKNTANGAMPTVNTLSIFGSGMPRLVEKKRSKNSKQS